MKTFGELLQEHKKAIAKRWLDAALSTYSEEASAAFRRQKNQFANPVGHSLRAGTQGIWEALLDGMDAEVIEGHLREIVKIRAVQQFSASEALGFVFRLKEAVRAELPEAAADAQFVAEWNQLDHKIDQIALAAFDIFVECREQVYQLRINEVKRSVAWVVDKLNGSEGKECGADPGSGRGTPV